MNLTKEQLDYIRSFIQQKGYNYIDVQLEILDHVASSVEEKMEENPLLGIDAAINDTQEAFGPDGFAVIQKSVVNGLKKKYSKFFWQNFLDYFGYKYILLVLFLGFVVYKLQEIVSNDDFYMIYIVGMFGVIGLLLLYNIKDSIYKKYMSYKSSVSFLMFLGPFLAITNIAINKSVTIVKIFSLNRSFLIVSVLITLFVIYFIAALKTAKVGMRASKHIMDKYKLVL
ncbi:hypothetical protein H9N25_03275 [Pedobacter riviphilus]|uniref:DUF1129 family protein n=1 Tax=Pedobacter riviphilus TaxID=2766984 RepID=A0ABX6TKS0_9SPHI|nr:hypothetical protein [Pedobacter riviphilus]QNR85511.1 hypothetical protein H9N25_03275 [Pedobacter riviphilus]